MSEAASFGRTPPSLIVVGLSHNTRRASCLRRAKSHPDLANRKKPTRLAQLAVAATLAGTTPCDCPWRLARNPQLQFAFPRHASGLSVSSQRHPADGHGPAARVECMQHKNLYFVIPTYRLRDVAETVEVYDEHFWRNGHAPKIIVFDDSSPVAQEKYYPLLEQTRTHNDVYYVGPKEKEQFTAYLSHRLRDKRLDGLVKNLFRPSYGGNRNFTLMYTLGGLMVSADDDMRPYALMEDSLESLEDGEISRGRLHRVSQNGYVRKSFDIVGSFLDVLGKTAGEVPANYESGEVLIDTAMDLETNASKGASRENSLHLHKGEVRLDAVVKMAQTFRSGTNDIDAHNYAKL